MLSLLQNYIQLKRALSLAHIQSIKSLGLGPRQAQILRTLDADGPSSAAALARATLSDPAAIHRAVQGLLHRGLLRQQDDAADRRRCRLSLTPGEGRRMAHQVAQCHAALAEEMARPLSPAERRRFAEMTQRMTQHLQATHSRHAATPEETDA